LTSNCNTVAPAQSAFALLPSQTSSYWAASLFAAQPSGHPRRVDARPAARIGFLLQQPAARLRIFDPIHISAPALLAAAPESNFGILEQFL
uniref:Clade I nitrous oxide reductase n=1 Tax=Macrostomum lignano TaxID=282301 RepID=A0A1I8HZP4_9PLAT